ALGGDQRAVYLARLKEVREDAGDDAESDDEPWKAESFLATSPEDQVENAGSLYNQTLARGNHSHHHWEHKRTDKNPQ
ncbi:coenzyme F420 hydrogenase/dehydrogenase beta subunit N-terminal domain-containing protein, partial [Halostella sp. PRR32]|uniref:coenzyme F420 hydrogenase/dehydrogenase beta subunit N-terminal domain-containing protein n=1 Tax=Halostella sp. PRR32 TaxID=3098147 RepID=UPI002B1D977E